jgi:hypothetical protein
MALAAYGTQVQESELAARARMVPTGMPIEEIERLARVYGLVAEIRNPPVEELRRILAEGKLPIAFIDRAIFGLTPAGRRRHSLRDAVMHTVIPVKFTAGAVTLHDPRFPRVTRRTLRLFRRAYEGLGGVCVVCARAEKGEEEQQGIPDPGS